MSDNFVRFIYILFGKICVMDIIEIKSIKNNFLYCHLE